MRRICGLATTPAWEAVMSIVPPAAVARTPDRAKVLENYVTYRRLLYRSYILYARIALLQSVLWVVSPIATPMIARTIRRWFDQIAADVRALSKAARNLRERMEQSSPVPAITVFENPWD
jgi:hypothetical protein